MKGKPIIVSKRKIGGVVIEKHRHGDSLGFLPEFFFVCRGERPLDIWTGDTPGEAISRMEASRAR